MATVDSWFWGFVGRHVERLPRADWPSLDSEFWHSWRSAFVRNGLREAEADEASEALAEAPPAFPDRQLGGLIEAVRLVRARHEAASRPAPRPAAPAVDHSRSNAEAEALWLKLDETHRDEWRNLVRERLPELARRPQFVEGLAKGWALDPSMIADPPPPRRTPPASSPRRGPVPVEFVPFPDPFKPKES